MPSDGNVGHRGQCLRIKNFSDFDSVKNWNSIRISQDQELELRQCPCQGRKHYLYLYIGQGFN